MAHLQCKKRVMLENILKAMNGHYLIRSYHTTAAIGRGFMDGTPDGVVMLQMARNLLERIFSKQVVGIQKENPVRILRHSLPDSQVPGP